MTVFPDARGISHITFTTKPDKQATPQATQTKRTRKTSTTMSSIFEPSESINYNFVSGVYGFFSALCLLLVGLHFVTPQVEGFFITLLPFLPCFLWSLVVRSKWLKQQKDAAVAAPATQEDEVKETKKDQ